jgi:hypothetical protein
MLYLVLGLCLSSPETIGPPTKIQAAPAEADLSGVYYVSGSDGKETYTGAAVIRQEGEVYVVQWTTGEGVIGVGVRQGDALAVSWLVNTAKGPVRGVTFYRLRGRTLEGAWATMPGAGVVRRETLTFLRGLEE